jgi:hypothetical protein
MSPEDLADVPHELADLRELDEALDSGPDRLSAAVECSLWVELSGVAEADVGQ